MPKYEVIVEATTQRDIIVDAVSEYEACVYSIQDFKLMVKYDMNIIQDEADRLTFLASMYRRAGVLKSNYPEDLFDEGYDGDYHTEVDVEEIDDVTT